MIVIKQLGVYPMDSAIQHQKRVSFPSASFEVTESFVGVFQDGVLGCALGVSFVYAKVRLWFEQQQRRLWRPLS